MCQPLVPSRQAQQPLVPSPLVPSRQAQQPLVQQPLWAS
jgi:hypothetical protein